jgi:hypothetical protein
VAVLERPDIPLAFEDRRDVNGRFGSATAWPRSALTADVGIRVEVR